ncbi:MAG: glycoside hydrolase family 97 protein, partial [Cyclobacteriaceae bacterium]|nr:glycoside hydrolase family 97 protein [Cyclobacteriaceae bacterium]
HRPLLLALFFGYAVGATAQSWQLRSPDSQVMVDVTLRDTLTYSITVKGQLLMKKAVAALYLNQTTIGIRSSVQSAKTKAVNETITATVPSRRKLIANQYNELALRFRNRTGVVFRAYNDGVAYRFETDLPFNTVTVDEEIARFRFANDNNSWFAVLPERTDMDIFHTSYEEPYQTMPVSGLRRGQIANTPALVGGPVRVFLTESDVRDYPSMYLEGTGSATLRVVFPHYPARTETEGGEFKHLVVKERAPYLARTAGKRTYPWRVIGLAMADKELPSNDIVYRLAAPPEARDWSWIEPGISTEEWIIGNNFRNVPFVTGINTATYKYYIDFAERFALDYVMLDAGWSDVNDLTKITPGLDLEEVARYAKQKGVKLILWTLSMTLDRQLEPALKEFNRLGVAGILTDFLDRDDQVMMQFYERIARACADHHLMVMYHGATKNAGFERTWPNAITREAVMGSEFNIWSEKVTPDHDLTIPFIRMTAGPMDYEPGLLDNLSKQSFKPTWERVSSMGTRAHQLAMFIVYESPVQMFSGNPSDGWLEPDLMGYMGGLPTVWDETKVLDGVVGDYIVTARKKDNDWYIGAMTDWTARELTIDLSFLGTGRYRLDIVQDGPNAARNLRDYQFTGMQVKPGQPLTIRLAAGGGFVAKVIRY